MAKPCEHLARVTPEDFAPQRTPGACEECLAEGTAWVALRECRSAVAIPRRESMRPNTSMRHNILSCELSRLRLGHGATSMRRRVSSVNLKLPHGEVVSCRGSIAGPLPDRGYDFTARHS
jgi:hypothetical protein